MRNRITAFLDQTRVITHHKDEHAVLDLQQKISSFGPCYCEEFNMARVGASDDSNGIDCYIAFPTVYVLRWMTDIEIS